MKELRKFWSRIFWAISKGDKTGYDSLKGTEVEEFWYLFEEYEKTLKPK